MSLTLSRRRAPRRAGREDIEREITEEVPLLPRVYIIERRRRRTRRRRRRRSEEKEREKKKRGGMHGNYLLFIRILKR